jgi:CRISPR/Cas system-associated exonuclease Cas4 (RecB family)
MLDLPRLSASKIKSYSNCSYLAYLRYNCGLPSSGNTGSRLGSVTHAILECLAEPKRREMVDQAIACKKPLSIPALNRMATILLEKEGENTLENFDKVDGFLLVALENDFHGKGCESYFTEYEFNVKNEKYWIYGFIDRMFVYSDKIRIVDFKTSKKKFGKGTDDMDFNVQALMYALVASKMYPGYKIQIEFQFLKFAKAPIISMEFTQAQIDGFESYLEYISNYLKDFGVEKALSDMASKDVKRRWLCGKEALTLKDDGSTAWSCEYRAPFLYFEAVKDGIPIKSAFTKKELDKYEKLGYDIIQRRHAGCPRPH